MQRIVFIVILFTLVLATACSSLVITRTPSPPRTKTFEDGFRRPISTESGTPYLNKIPGVNRLFSNTTIDYRFFIWDAMPSYLLSNTAAAVSTDGTRLLVGRDNGGGVSLFNLLDPEDHQIDLVPSRNDGQVLYYEVKPDGEISFGIDIFNDKIGSWVDWLQWTPDASAFLVYRVCHQKDEEPEYRLNVTETMELFDRTGRLLRAIPIEPKFKAGTVSPDGRLLLAAGPSSLEYWDLTTGQKVGSVPLYGIGELSDLRCTPDGRFIFLVPKDGNIRVYDFRSMAEVATLPVENGQTQIDISPDGRVLVVVLSFGLSQFDASKPSRIQRFDVVTPYRIQRYEIGSWQTLPEIKQTLDEKKTRYHFSSVRFSQDGNRLLALGSTRSKAKKGDVELRSALFEFDLSSPGGDWQPVDFTALPLHADGKFLLDGRYGSSPSFEAFVERGREMPW